MLHIASDRLYIVEHQRFDIIICEKVGLNRGYHCASVI